MLGLTLPPLEFYAFAPPILLQCLLLHPVFPDFISRPLRASLVPPSLWYAFTTPLKYRIEPRTNCVLLNFFVGVLACLAIWRTLEWGFAIDRTPYVWIGLDSDLEVSKDADGKVKIPLRKDRTRLEAVQAKVAATDSPVDVLVSTLHLFVSLRGTGYAFGPSVKVLKATSDPTSTLLTFVKYQLVRLATSHAALVGAGIVITAQPASRIECLHHIFPNLPINGLSFLADFITNLALGMSVVHGFTLCYIYLTLVTLAISSLLSFLRIPILGSFDARQYHRLFYRVWTDSSTSVSLFWAQGWHSFLRRPFQTVGGDPTLWIVERLGGSKRLASDLSVLSIFGLSAWIHEQAIYWATTHISPYDPPLPFRIRWGGTLFFMLQGVAIILERHFTSATGRKVRGPLGTAWTYLWLAVLGTFTVAKTWTTLGLFGEIPDVTHWTWPRFVVPLMCLAPSTVAAK